MMNVLQTVFEVYYLRNKQIQAKLPGNTDSDPFQLLVECGCFLASLGLQLVVLCHLHRRQTQPHMYIITLYMYSVYILYIHVHACIQELIIKGKSSHTLVFLCDIHAYTTPGVHLVGVAPPLVSFTPPLRI